MRSARRLLLRLVPRGRDERGSALIELVWLGVLLLVPLLWLVISVFEVQRGAFAVSAAARAAGRAYVLSDSDGQGERRGQAVVDQTLASQGPDGMTGSFRVVRCSTRPCISGTGVVTVEVTSQVRLPLLPAILGEQRGTFALDARHVVPVGQYVEAAP